MRELSRQASMRAFSKAGAFTLVEVVLALGITAFAIVSILGMLSGALQINRESEQRIQAADLATILMVQYREALNSGVFPDKFPLPRQPSATTAPGSYDAPVAINGLGGKTQSLTHPDTAYALSCATWKTPVAKSYSIVNCALRFQWPATRARKSENLEHYEVTSSFFVKTAP